MESRLESQPDSRASTPDGGIRERLPNLFEVLSRRTLAPVDLYSFYIYMRDVQRSVDYLDFWLDVSQHMSLCRHYVRELRRSVLMSTPDLEKSGSKRSSQVLDNYTLEHAALDPGPSGTARYNPPTKDRTERERNRISTDQRLSAFLRSDGGSKHSPQSSTGGATEDNTPSSEHPPRTSTSPSPLVNSSSSPDHTVARADIRASAEKILYIFLLPGAEREIILPQGILNEITSAIEKEGRDDPEVFDAAKDYVFQAMERDAFPGFLRSKALGNLVQASMLLRLTVGIVSGFAAFWTAFVLIFLDRSRADRCWLIWPFTVSLYCIFSHMYTLDPVLAMAGYSEYTFMRWHRVKEIFVGKLLMMRALMCIGWIFALDIALCCLFIFVPGARL
ncbi:hypothetical protein LTR08_004198 [Meristemomyces frigidus]|nr:hypothetical protein LTR08_004198 [Meristemomyces frigidus]